MFAPRFFPGRYFARRYYPRGTNLAAQTFGEIAADNRFRTATVPQFTSMDEVQRFLQHTMDEISRALNPIRTVADGGTGIAALNQGEILAGGTTPNTFARVQGGTDTVRRVLTSVGTGVNAGVPFWDVISASQVGVTGTPVTVGGVAVTVGGVAVVTIP